MTTFEVITVVLLAANFAIDIYRAIRDFGNKNNRSA